MSELARGDISFNASRPSIDHLPSLDTPEERQNELTQSIDDIIKKGELMALQFYLLPPIDPQNTSGEKENYVFEEIVDGGTTSVTHNRMQTYQKLRESFDTLAQEATFLGRPYDSTSYPIAERSPLPQSLQIFEYFRSTTAFTQQLSQALEQLDASASQQLSSTEPTPEQKSPREQMRETLEHTRELFLITRENYFNQLTESPLGRKIALQLAHKLATMLDGADAEVFNLVNGPQLRDTLPGLQDPDAGPTQLDNLVQMSRRAQEVTTENNGHIVTTFADRASKILHKLPLTPSYHPTRFILPVSKHTYLDLNLSSGKLQLKTSMPGHILGTHAERISNVALTTPEEIAYAMNHIDASIKDLSTPDLFGNIHSLVVNIDYIFQLLGELGLAGNIQEDDLIFHPKDTNHFNTPYTDTQLIEAIAKENDHTMEGLMQDYETWQNRYSTVDALVQACNATLFKGKKRPGKAMRHLAKTLDIPPFQTTHDLAEALSRRKNIPLFFSLHRLRSAGFVFPNEFLTGSEVISSDTVSVYVIEEQPAYKEKEKFLIYHDNGMKIIRLVGDFSDDDIQFLVGDPDMKALAHMRGVPQDGPLAIRKITPSTENEQEPTKFAVAYYNYPEVIVEKPSENLS